MKSIYFLVILCFGSVFSFSQNKEDIKSIESLCGCFEVSFMYAETFSPDTAYKFGSRYKAVGLELVVAEESGPKKFVFQHLLLADEDVIKHWREDWVYENTDQLQFVQAAQWKPLKLSAAQTKGKWTQSVWEVDDAPRYTGIATWIHADGKNYWENTTDAPLPRREYSKRNDYNIMRRGNRIAITDSGWVHEQDNDKIVRNEKGDRLLAKEKGYNIYRKVDPSRCALAKTWWDKNKTYWNTVRASWETLLKDKSMVHVQQKVNDKVLWQYLFDTQNEFTHEAFPASELPIKIKTILNKFLQ